MKRIISLFIVFIMLLTCTAAFADNMGVQVVSGADTDALTASLDDIKLNEEVEIEGYAIILPNEYSFEDKLGYYLAGTTKVDWYDWAYNSGQDAEYAILRMDITNTSTKPKDFLSNCEVKIIFDGLYEYAGWFYQVNYNNRTEYGSSFGNDSEKQNFRWAINEADNFAIDPMYMGHYIFGCTVPNAVVNSKAPLRMIITLDGNEITYNVRK